MCTRRWKAQMPAVCGSTDRPTSNTFLVVQGGHGDGQLAHLFDVA